MDLKTATIEQLITQGDAHCACGRPHQTDLSFVRIGPGAIEAVPEALSQSGITHPFIVFDENTHRVAWPLLEPILQKSGIRFSSYILRGAHINPDEQAVGALLMAFGSPADGILAVGSGVINDCCKVLSYAARVPSVVLATAPSMDGYASNSSSMINNGIKVTLYNACPVAIIGDIDIIRDAPMRMLWAGLGDMLAKYISICEWRIAHLVTGEYYCENVAGLVRASLQKIWQNAEKLAQRDPDAVHAVMEGLVLSGIAMSFAQVSRPASGLEHYFSHVWEMIALERGKPHDLHGIQVGVGTYLTLRLYEQIKALHPDVQKATAFVASFDQASWETRMRDIFGSVAETLIEKEHTEYRKNDPKGHAERIVKIQKHWPEILRIIDEELPPAQDILRLAQKLQMPILPQDLSISDDEVRKAFIGSRDIRDKYLASSLLWDLGLLHEIDFPKESN